MMNDAVETITPQMLPLVELDQAQIEAVLLSVPGGAGNVQDVYPLSPAQQGILFHRLLGENGDPYVLSTLFQVDSRARLDALIDALQRVIDRHDILRTAVIWEGLPVAVQVVYRRASLPVEDLAPEPTRDPLERLNEFMEPLQQQLDIRRAPLSRLLVSVDGRGGWYALLQLHHLACDDPSWRMVIDEALACLNGREKDLPTPLAYRTYVEQALAATEQTQQSRSFFRSKLALIDEPTAPFGLLDVRQDGTRTKEARGALHTGLAWRVRSQARRLGVGAARLFHAAWALVVAHTSGRDDVVFGTVLLGVRQKRADAQRMIGISINTLPLALRLGGVTADELVQQTHREIRELLEHRHASLVMAQQCSGVAGAAPLFSALLNYRHRVSSDEDPIERGGPLAVICQRGARTNYPITLAVDDLGREFGLTAQTDERVDPHRVLAYVETALQSLVDALENAPQTAALLLPIIPLNERRTILEHFSAARAQYADDKLIHELFEQQARRTPEAIAVVHEDRLLTYGELDHKANQLAWCLRAKGVGPDGLVGICVERGLEMVIGLLAILKAGGAYLPLDPHYPPERLHYMLEDAKPLVLLIQEASRALLHRADAELVAIDGDWSEIATRPSIDPAARRLGLRSHHLAYVMYTSGSTGRPKGVMVEHRNVARLFAATAHWFDFSATDVWTLFHSYAFDFSVWELWGALFHGGQVVVVPYLATRTPTEFYRLLCDRRVTVLSQTPSAFVQLIDAQARNPQQHSLRAVIFGGEALELHILRPWVERNGVQQPRLINMYGITETTVHVTYRCLTAEDIQCERGSVIGRPIPDLHIHVLNRFAQPVPIGVAGEMYVGGAGVARGYLNRAELTAERFIVDPFDPLGRTRLYRTGDLGRWRPDGTLEYAGRNDEQVKIRGFRIELGEIQAQLAQHPQVREDAVVVREDVPGDKRLVAYVVATDVTDAPTASSLRAHLRSVLPDHMVPSAFVTIERLPLTSNGKLDRRVLPAPALDAYISRQHAAPQGVVEQMLASVWGELLHVERVSREDNFFELGGHSLLAMQLIARVHSLLSIEISMRTLFEIPTLRELADHLAQLGRAALLERVSAEGDAQLEHLLEELSSMSDGRAEALLQELVGARNV
jgi:amino acid adenylation domain-containing protein